jgi:hypothetical protein
MRGVGHEGRAPTARRACGLRTGPRFGGVAAVGARVVEPPPRRSDRHAAAATPVWTVSTGAVAAPAHTRTASSSSRPSPPPSPASGPDVSSNAVDPRLGPHENDIEFRMTAERIGVSRFARPARSEDVTRNELQLEWGSSRLAAGSKIWSLGRGCGRFTWRRSTNSCRRTTISSSLGALRSQPQKHELQKTAQRQVAKRPEEEHLLEDQRGRDLHPTRQARPAGSEPG